MLIWFLLLLLTLNGCSTRKVQETSQGDLAAERLVLSGATLIDGTDGGPVKNATVVIAGKRIQAVLPPGTAYKSESKTKVIRLDGKFLLPGLFDAHVHYLGWAGPLYLASGITSITDAGNWTAWILAQRFAVSNDLVPGPRIFTCGGQIDSPPGSYPHSINVSTEAEAQAIVRQHVRRGVDFIKAYTMLRPPLVKAIIEEAHAAGIPVRGHITISAREAAEFGIDSLEHMSGIAIATTDNEQKLSEIEKRRAEPGFLPSTVSELASYMKPERFDDLIRLLIKQKTMIAPTLVSWWMGVHPRSRGYDEQDQSFFADSRNSFIPELSRRGILLRYSRNAGSRSDAKFKAGYANTQRFIKAFVDAGGKVVAGSDATLLALHGLDLHRELELLVDAGLSPLQALQAATRNPAELMRQGSELGTIESGKLADMIVVSGDPLRDIRNTRNVELVIKEGRVLDINYDASFVDMLPRPLTKDYLKMLGIDDQASR